MADDVRRPHFSNPPVVEVVCGVQFADIRGWGSVDFGNYGSFIEDRYPNSEDHPPLAKMRLDGAEPSSGPIAFALPPFRRVFFVEPNGNFLIQVQPDRFVHNWRKVHLTDAYPRYEVAFKRFFTEFEAFCSYLRSKEKPVPEPAELELTYVNQIVEAGAAFPRDVFKFLRFYSSIPDAVGVKPATSMSLSFKWPLQQQNGGLRMNVKHGLRTEDDAETLLVELSVQGRASVRGVGGLQGWFDAAHSTIVNSFEALTTPQAHGKWGKF